MKKLSELLGTYLGILKKYSNNFHNIILILGKLGR